MVLWQRLQRERTDSLFLLISSIRTSEANTRRQVHSSRLHCADFKTFVLDPEVGYRLVDNPEKNASIDVLGGVRYWHLRTDITLNPGLLSAVTASRSRGWVDAVAGLSANTDISKRIFITGKTDLGGGGSHFTYQLFGGVGLHMGIHFSLIGGYRHLSVDYNKDGFLFDTALAGPVFGLAIRF